MTAFIKIFAVCFLVMSCTFAQNINDDLIASVDLKKSKLELNNKEEGTSLDKVTDTAQAGTEERNYMVSACLSIGMGYETAKSMYHRNNASSFSQGDPWFIERSLRGSLYLYRFKIEYAFFENNFNTYHYYGAELYDSEEYSWQKISYNLFYNIWPIKSHITDIYIGAGITRLKINQTYKDVDPFKTTQLYGDITYTDSKIKIYHIETTTYAPNVKISVVWSDKLWKNTLIIGGCELDSDFLLHSIQGIEESYRPLQFHFTIFAGIGFTD